MRLAHPGMDAVLSFTGSCVNCLVIESPCFLRTFLKDISSQLQGESGTVVLSRENTPISFSGNAEMIDSILSFQISRKSLINKLIARMEELSTNEEHYVRTAELISALEQHLADLAFDLPCDVVCSKLTFGSLLRAVGLEIPNDYENDLEQFLDYMELARELERDKLFVFVNLRSFYTDDELQPFFDTIVSHQYHVLMIDSISRKQLIYEKRITIDSDLCEF